MDVRVDQRRRQQAAAGLELNGALGVERPTRSNRDDPSIADAHVDGLRPTAAGRVEPGISNQKIQRLALPPSGAPTWFRVANGLRQCRAGRPARQGESRTRVNGLAEADPGCQYWLTIASIVAASLAGRPPVYGPPTGQGPKTRV